MKILVAEDEPITRLRIEKTLAKEGYGTESFENGLAALSALKKDPEQYQVIILDRMMPGMDGLEVLRNIKDDPAMQTVPVIMETGLDSREEILDGLNAGAYYYLTKPFLQEALVAIVKTAVNDHERYRNVQNQARDASSFVTFIEEGVFVIRTMTEARILSSVLGLACPNPNAAVVGLSELLFNAIEYGTLGLSYKDKTDLIASDTFHEEIHRLSGLPENANKTVTLEFERNNEELKFLIRDKGPGFDWRSYLQISPDRAFDNHGRGIAMSRAISFDRIEYRGTGNEVLAVIKTAFKS